MENWRLREGATWDLLASNGGFVKGVRPSPFVSLKEIQEQQALLQKKERDRYNPLGANKNSEPVRHGFTALSKGPPK